MSNFFRLIVFASLAVWITACQAAPEIPVTDGVIQAQVTAEPVPPASTPLMGQESVVPPVELAFKRAEESSADPRYQIELRYPYLTGEGSQSISAFNQQVENLVFGLVGSFKQDLASTSSDPNFDQWPSQLSIDFLPTYIAPDTAAVLIKISAFLPGAAHPGHVSHAINYNLRTGHAIDLPELFLPGAAYLETLSAYCIEDLRSRSRLEWEDGVQPRIENFNVWNITPEGLLITFDEYQVAPYAAGPQAVLVPYDHLRDVANPQGPIGSLIP
jgi:hypothetical protein